MAIAIANCPRCSLPFIRIRSEVCQNCAESEAADYGRVRDALFEHPGLTTDQLSELTGVDHGCILRMLKEGHIAAETVDHAVKCGRCGAPALSIRQRLCTSCLYKMNADVSKAMHVTRKNLPLRGTLTGFREELEAKRAHLDAGKKRS